MQLIGGQAATMGLFFASVGVGCVFGPLGANAFLRDKFMLSCVLASGIVAASYALLAGATQAGALGFLLVVFATMVRSCGSSVLWIWSTTLIQARFSVVLYCFRHSVVGCRTAFSELPERGEKSGAIAHSAWCCDSI